MQKSCKGNIVEAQLNNRSLWAMPKVLERQHRDAQVAHTCVSPPSISHGGEWFFSTWFTHLYVLSCPILRQILPVIHMILYITFHVFYFSTILLHNLFRMGEKDYLYDNLNTEAILRKRQMLIFFVLFTQISTSSKIDILLRLFDWIDCPLWIQWLVTVLSH
jgi:hypothetical protein